MSASDYIPGGCPEFMEEMDDPDDIKVSYDDIKRESEKAFLFVIEQGDDFSEPPIEERAEWIPKSQMYDHNRETKTFYVPEWLAGEKGLI